MRSAPFATITPPMCDAARDQPLADAHQLGCAAGVDAVAARAVLAGHLAHARVHAERAPARRAAAPAVASKRAWMPAAGRGRAPRARAQIVSSWKTAARPPASRTIGLEAPVRGPPRTASAYPPATASCLAKATIAPGRASAASRAAPRPPRAPSARERSAVSSGRIGEGIADQTHWHKIWIRFIDQPGETR